MTRWAFLAAALMLGGCYSTEMSEADKQASEALAAAERKWEGCVSERRVAAQEWEVCLDKERQRAPEARNFDACGPRPYGPERCGISPMEQWSRAQREAIHWQRLLSTR